MENLNTNRIIVFIGFVIVFIGVQIAMINNLEIPEEVYAILSTLGAALAGLVTNPVKDVE